MSSPGAVLTPARLSATGTAGRLIRNVALLSSSQVVTWVLTAAYTVIVTRAIGPDGAGRMAIGLSSTSIAGAVVALGLQTYIVKETARDPERAPRLVGSAILLQAVATLPALGALWLYATHGHFDREQQLVIAIYSAAMIPVWLGTTVQAPLKGMQQMEAVALSGVMQVFILSVGGIALVAAGQGVVSIVALGLAGQVVVAGFCLYALRRQTTIDFTIDTALARQLATEGLPFLAYNLIFAGYLWIDTVLLSLLVPQPVVGWYGAGSRLFGTLYVVPAILAAAWLPRLSAAYKHSPADFQKEARLSIELVLLAALPMAVGAALVGPQLIVFIYGPAFAPAGPVFSILAVTLCPSYFTTMAYQVLVAGDRVRAWTKLLAATTVFNPLINLALIPHFQAAIGNGAVGAALSLLATEVLMCAGAIWLLRSTLAGSSTSRIGRTALAAGAMGVVVVAASPFGVIAEVVAGMAAYGALAVVLRLFRDEEIEYVRARLEKVTAAVRRRLP